MDYPAISTSKVWKLCCLGAALILGLASAGLMPPGTLPYPPVANISDAAISHWPNAYFLSESVWHYGEWPLWNPLRMLGQPFAANPLAKIWYPPQWLALLLPPTLHLNFMVYLHMAWLALGMCAWMRSEQVRPSTAFFATLAWGLTPKLIGHLGAGHLDIVYALAWVPWLLWGLRQVVNTGSIGWGALVGAIAAMLVLADLRIAFYMLPVASTYGVATSLLNKAPLSKSWRSWAVAATLLLLLTAVQTIPLLALSPYLTRASLTPHEAAVYSLPLRYLMGLLIPDVGGFHEWMTYLGMPVVGLAATGLLLRRGDKSVWLWWGVVLLALLWALGENGPLFLVSVEHLPLAGWFRVPSRAWFMVALSLIIASVYGLESLTEHGLGRRGRLIMAAVAFAGVVWTFAALAFPGLPPVLVGVGAAVTGTSVGMWLAGGGLVDLVWFHGYSAGRRKQDRLAGVVVLVVTLAVSLLAVDVTLVRPQSLAHIEQPERATIAEIPGACRSVFSPTFSLIGPATARARLATLHGVDPFQLKSSARIIAVAAGTQVDDYSIIVPPLPLDETDVHDLLLDIDLLQRLGVCGVVSRPGLSADRWQPAAHVDDVDIYSLPTSKPEVGVTYVGVDLSTGNNVFRTQVCSYIGSGWGVVRQAWAPGWQARVDGKPITLTSWNGLLAFSLAGLSGCQELELNYRPQADFVGMAVTGITIMMLAAWSIYHRWKGTLRA